MRRRAMMKTVGVVATTSTAGCMGGGEVVTEIQRRVTVEPGRYWSRELPDVSDPGGSIEYVLGGDRAFDLLFFTSGEDFTAYREALRGEEPDRTPTGHDEFSETAVPVGDGDGYEATTKNGARESLDAEGPYYVVVDHTDYGVGARPGDPGSALSVTVDLTLVKNRI